MPFAPRKADTTACPACLPQGTQRRLGIVFCYNRPCFLYYLPLGAANGSDADPPAAIKLTPSCLSASSPLFSPDGSELLFLSHYTAASTGVHSATVSLSSLTWSAAVATPTASKPRTIVGVVRRPGDGVVASNASFPGLYAYNFVDSPWVNGSTVLLTSQWRSCSTVLAIDVKTGAVWPLTDTDACNGSWTLQGVCDGRVAAIWSRPGAPPQLMLADAADIKPGGVLIASYTIEPVSSFLQL